MYHLTQTNHLGKKHNSLFPQMKQEIPLLVSAKKIGSGVFGKVYRAIDINSKKNVALKRVQKFTDNMSREIEVLYALRQQPHCVKMIDFFFTCQGEKIIENLILEYIPETLQTMFDQYFEREKKLSQWQILTIMRQLLKGMEQIHSQKILHRDIKPDNIFISEDLKVIKFGDFGASKFMNKAKPGYPTRVSQSYRAPQMMCGSSIHTEKIDIWSLGCVFLELFSLQPFFERMDSDAAQFYYTLTARGGFNKEVGKSFCKLFLDQSHARRVQRQILIMIPSSRKLTIPQMLADRGLSPSVDPRIFKVIEKMIDPDPFKRPTASQLIKLAEQEKIFDSLY